jgi:hypothetical protein
MPTAPCGIARARTGTRAVGTAPKARRPGKKSEIAPTNRNIRPKTRSKVPLGDFLPARRARQCHPPRSPARAKTHSAHAGKHFAVPKECSRHRRMAPRTSRRLCSPSPPYSGERAGVRGRTASCVRSRVGAPRMPTPGRCLKLEKGWSAWACRTRDDATRRRDLLIPNAILEPELQLVVAYRRSVAAASADWSAFVVTSTNLA